MTDDEKLYVRFRGRTVGPLTSQKIREMVRRGQITRLHELSDDGTSWSRADEFRDFFSTMRAEIAKNLGPLSTNAPHAASAAAIEPAAGPLLNPQPAAEPKIEWYAHVDDEHQGPMTLDVMRQWKESGRVRGSTLVWRKGLETWLPAKKALPELFAAAKREPESPSQQDAAPSDVTDHGASSGLAVLAIEMNRQRTWASVLGMVLMLASCLAIVGQAMALFVGGTGESEAATMIPGAVGGILGIAFAATVMIAGVLLLRFCSSIAIFALQKSDSSALEAAQRLNVFWSFAGIASLLWLVVVTGVVIVVMMGVAPPGTAT